MKAPASAPVLIAGGGIAGLASALALAQKGIPSQVFEQAPAFSELGAGVQLGPNAVAVLAALGLKEAALALACRPQSLHIRRISSGRSLSTWRIGSAVAQRYGQPYISIHRGHLHGLLLQAARAQPHIDLCSGQSVQSWAEDAQNGLRIQLEAGGSATGRALLACDGVWSRLRPSIAGSSSPAQYSGHSAYRALLPRSLWPAGQSSRLGQELGLWLGRKAHIVHYPIASGDLLNIVVLIEKPADATQGWEQAIAAHSVQAELNLASQGHACPELQNLIHAAQNWFSWPLHGLPSPPPTWVRGAAALVGDAAHPMLPYLAQGAAMALEDAWVLAQNMARHSSAQHALQHYQSQRQARCQRVVSTAARNAKIFHLSGPAAWARDAYLQAKNGQALGMAWLYGWQP